MKDLEKKEEYTLIEQLRLKAIAFFVGWVIKNDGDGKPYFIHPNYNKIYYVETAIIFKSNKGFQYYTSYDWLMPVVEKIENNTTKDNGIQIYRNGCSYNGNIYAKATKLESIFKLVSDFCIEWCNENNIKID